jgi:hypothetical protein
MGCIHDELRPWIETLGSRIACSRYTGTSSESARTSVISS